MKELILILSSFLIISNQLLAQTVRDISKKEVFTKGFPQSLSFRNDRLVQGKDFLFWEQAHLPYNAITKKYLNEEIVLDPMFAKWANMFASRNPEKLMLIHLNGECTSIENKEVHKTFFPGHWAYEAGTTLRESISKSDKTIKVRDATIFSKTAHTIMGGPRKGELLPHSIIP